MLNFKYLTSCRYPGTDITRPSDVKNTPCFQESAQSDTKYNNPSMITRQSSKPHFYIYNKLIKIKAKALQ